MKERIFAEIEGSEFLEIPTKHVISRSKGKLLYFASCTATRKKICNVVVKGENGHFVGVAYVSPNSNVATVLCEIRSDGYVPLVSVKEALDVLKKRPRRLMEFPREVVDFAYDGTPVVQALANFDMFISTNQRGQNGNQL